ncbi:MAG: GNAT family N-acetyltransferase [Candidatus Aminicenantes bacterium]|nr:GNAT family N-acetyltransferase [Candidatus Aminicenantes bacterium]
MRKLVVAADTPERLAIMRRLFREYQELLGVDLCFQGFEDELAELPGKYAPPTGALLLAFDGEEAQGCVALRGIAPGVCEMKRLYVRPAYRGQGLGRTLAEAVIAEGRRIGYRTMRLDTLEKLREAIGLYESLGFRRIPPYYANPLPGVIYWELDLTTA